MLCDYCRLVLVASPVPFVCSFTCLLCFSQSAISTSPVTRKDVTAYLMWLFLGLIWSYLLQKLLPPH